MKRTTYQVPELRDENDNIIQEGTFGKHSAFSNSTNDGAFDYILNDLEALYDAQTAAGNAITTGGLTVSGKTTTGTLEAGDTTVTGTVTTSGLTVTGETSVPTANEGNSSKAIANTEFVAKSLASLVNGAPAQLNTLNELAKALGNDANFSATITAELAKKLNSAEAESTYATKTEAGVPYQIKRNTAYKVGDVLTSPSLPYYVLRCTVAGTSGAAEPDYTDVALGDKITDGTVTWVVDGYLPLSGGTMTGVLTNNGSTSIPINIKTTGTDYRDIQIESSDGNHRIATIRASKTSEGRCEITIGASTTSNAAPTGITISRSTTNIYATAPTPDATDNSQKIATTRFVRTIVPAGVVLAYARGAVPTGWLLCDGSAVSRTDYAALYAVIGTTYGSGNGSTTFNLPNLVDKFVEGSATAGTVKSAGLPNITGSVQFHGAGTATVLSAVAGAFNLGEQRSAYIGTTGVQQGASSYDSFNFDASRSSVIYGNSNTVQPPSVTMRYIIKY